MLTHTELGDNYKDEELINRIVDLTASPHSVDFYKKAIRVLGWDLVNLEFREVAGWVNEGKDIDPAKVLTSLLNKAMQDIKIEPKKKSPFCPSKEILMQCFSISRPPAIESDNGAIDAPYSTGRKAFPTSTYLSPRFFTLSSNKAKSDKVIIDIPVGNGEKVSMEFLRGKRQAGKEAEELGLLNAEHRRILGALDAIWAEQGSLVKGGLCFCLPSVYRVAELLGWKKLGGSTLVHLTDKIAHLQARSFYNLTTQTEFRFISMKTIFRPKGSKQSNYIEIYFSPEHSDFLKNKWTVSRSTESLTMKSEIGVLLKDYLEPILISKYPHPHKIELINLIDELNLSVAAWHGEKKQRKQKFMVPIKEVNKQRTADGRYFDLKIIQGENREDFMLEARLTKEYVLLEEEQKKEITLKVCDNRNNPYGPDPEPLRKQPCLLWLAFALQNLAIKKQSENSI